MASGWYKGGYRSGYVGQGYTPGYPPPDATNPPSTGLAGWWRADKGLGIDGNSKVANWTDQSGRGLLVNAFNGGGRSAINPSSINGKPGLVMVNNGGTSEYGYQDTTTDVLAPGHARHIFVVCKTAAVSGVQMVPFASGQFNFDAVFACYLETAGGVNYCYSDGTAVNQETPGFAVQPNTAYVLEWTWDGNNAHLVGFIVNGVAQTVTGGPTTSTEAGNPGFALGNVSVGPGQAEGSQGFNGDYCETLVYDHVLSAGDLATTYAYLTSRYGINL